MVIQSYSRNILIVVSSITIVLTAGASSCSTALICKQKEDEN
jgi:hypothetical protein